MIHKKDLFFFFFCPFLLYQRPQKGFDVGKRQLKKIKEDGNERQEV
jgi:hypothetical protein